MKLKIYYTTPHLCDKRLDLGPSKKRTLMLHLYLLASPYATFIGYAIARELEQMVREAKNRVPKHLSILNIPYAYEFLSKQLAVLRCRFYGIN
jgi:hypothetical protein